MEKAIQALLATELEAFDTWNGHSLAPPCQWWISHCTKNWQGFELLIYYIQYMIHPIRAREIPTCCGENGDWVGFGWAKAAFNGFGNLWLFPTNYRSIGSVLHFSFQISPLNHYTPMVPAFCCWLNPPIWMVDINWNKQCYPGRAQFMDDWADQ